MCGIVGYVGGRPCLDLLVAGLEKLEYRGYDSAGISVIDDGKIEGVRAVGNLENLRAAVAEQAENGGGVAVAATAATTGVAPTHTATAPIASTSSSTGSSRTTPNCAVSWPIKDIASAPRPMPRSSPT